MYYQQKICLYFLKGSDTNTFKKVPCNARKQSITPAKPPLAKIFISTWRVTINPFKKFGRGVIHNPRGHGKGKGVFSPMTVLHLNRNLSKGFT